MDTGRGRAAAVLEAGDDHIDDLVRDLFELVANGVLSCVGAFLDADRETAGAVARRDLQLDDLEDRIEELALDELTASPPPAPARLRFLVAILRIIPELERSGDLIEHVARRTGTGLVGALTPRACGLIAEMGTVASAMWSAASEAYRTREPAAADRLRRDDDELDQLHLSLTAELAATKLPVAVAIELGLVARFLERLGDHAVNVTHRLDDFSS